MIITYLIHQIVQKENSCTRINLSSQNKCYKICSILQILSKQYKHNINIKSCIKKC